MPCRVNVSNDSWLGYLKGIIRGSVVKRSHNVNSCIWVYIGPPLLLPQPLLYFKIRYNMGDSTE